VLRSRSLFVLIALLGVIAPVQAQETDNVQWKFEKGKTFYQEMTTDTKQEMDVMNMKINQTQKQTFYISWTPEQENPDKSWVIKQKIEGVKMDINIGGNAIQYDSTKPADANPLSDFFKALVGAEFKLTISPDMKVTKIEGREDFIKKLQQANPQMEPLLKQILSDDALKQMSDPAFGVVPGKPVKKGDTWERKSTLNMGPIGTYDTTYKYTDEGRDEKDKNLVKIKVDTTLKYVPPSPGAAPGLPFRIASAKLETKEATGTILFDTAKHRVASSNLSLKLDGTLSIDVSGMQSDVKLSQTQTTTVKTTDENPIKKTT
jgi:Family of unknown function (DUF6263)